MPSSGKPGKKKRGRASPRELLWQLTEPAFEMHHWWLKSALKDHPELAQNMDERKRPTARIAPVVWEILRRHDQVPFIRKELAEFMNLSDEISQPVLQRHGFGIEYLLASCGLIAWVSTKAQSALPRMGIIPGLHPFNRPQKLHFESMMPEYASGKRHNPGWFDTRDLLKEAHVLGPVLKELGEKVDDVQSAVNPLFPIVSDPYVLLALEMLIQAHANCEDRTIAIEVRSSVPRPLEHPASALPEDVDYLHFNYEHFRHIDCFAKDLMARKEPVSQLLWKRMPKKFRAAVERIVGEFCGERDPDGPDVDMDVVQESAAQLATFLNSIIVGDCISNERGFPRSLLESDEELLSKSLRDAEPIEVNRKLLEAAYPNYILKAKRGQESWALGAIPDEVPAPAKRTPQPHRRPRKDALKWISEVEANQLNNRPDYDRMMNGIRFPLLPSLSDPDGKDSLQERLNRVKSDLQEPLAHQKTRIALFEKRLARKSDRRTWQ